MATAVEKDVVKGQLKIFAIVQPSNSIRRSRTIGSNTAAFVHCHLHIRYILNSTILAA